MSSTPSLLYSCIQPHCRRVTSIIAERHFHKNGNPTYAASFFSNRTGRILQLASSTKQHSLPCQHLQLVHQELRSSRFHLSNNELRHPTYTTSRTFTTSQSTMAPTEVPKVDLNNLPKDKQPIVISGPSGSGKSTMLNRLFEKYPGRFGFSVSRMFYLRLSQTLGSTLLL